MVADQLSGRRRHAPPPRSGIRDRAAWIGALALGAPWWARVLAVFLASRLITTTFLLIAAAMQPANPFTAAQPSYLDYAIAWDGSWYERIAAAGYPRELPLSLDGEIGENAWAFLPLFPALVGAIAGATGIPFAAVAITVSTLAALGTALLLFRLLIRMLSESTAHAAVVLFCVAPLSPILQVAYAESLQLLFITMALILVLDRRYLLLVPVVLVLGFTRPTGLAMALFLILHLAVRWIRRSREPLTLRATAGLAAAAGTSALAGVAWPAIAGAVTGVPDAYTRTELVWRAGYIGRGELIPFTPWFQGADWWLRFIGVPGDAAPVVGAILVIVTVLLFAGLLLTPAARRLGTDLRLWSVAYALYLLAVFFPQSSTFRLLMPLFPLLGVVAQARPRVVRVAIIVVALALQAIWIRYAWFVDGTDWSPP